MPLFFKKTFFLTLLLALALPAPLVEAANIGNTTGYAWSEKAGWIRFDGTDSAVNYGVTVSDTGLTGYAWSEKLGFINFDDAGGLYAVADDNLGNLSGYAWNEAAGFINFDDAGGLYQVVISGSTGIFSGYAWSEKTGFINFNDAGDLYAVETDWLSSYPIIQSADLLTHNDGDTIYAGQQYTWRVVLLDMNGFTDLDNVVLHLDYDGTDKTATWTEASDSFSTAAASDFFTLNSTSANSACGLAGGQADDNTCTLDFVLTMGWNWPETDGTATDIRVVATDGATHSDTDDFITDTFQLENDLRFTNIAYDNTRNPGVSTTVTGDVDYDGVTEPNPPDSTDVRVNPDWTATSYDDTALDGSSSFSIDFTTDTNIGASNFDVEFLNPPTGAGATSAVDNTVTVDRVKITGIDISNHLVTDASGRFWDDNNGSGDAVTITLTGVLESDGATAVTGGTAVLGYAGNTSAYGASGAFSAGTATLNVEENPTIGNVITRDNITISSVSEGGNNSYGTAVNVNSENTEDIGWDYAAPSTISLTSPLDGHNYQPLLVPDPFTGSVADTNVGITADTTTFSIKRSSDNAYWTGADWGAITELATTHLGTTDSTASTWTDSIALPVWEDLVNYTIVTTATDRLGNAASSTATILVRTNTAPTPPTTLYTNNTNAQAGSANPTNISDLTPVFSAIYNDNDSGDIANKYCIQVNTASNFAGTNMWMSDGNNCATGSAITNIIAGNRSTDIAYAGTALAVDGSIYYWRVRFWDDDDYQGEWSAPAASFRMSSSPGSSDVTSVTARTVETWYQEGAFAFSSTALNAGDVAYYCYVWDRSGVTSVDDNPPNCTVATGQGKWSSGDLSFSDTLLYNSKNIYLHVLAYNADDQADPSGTQSYGPFYFVNTSRILHGGKFFDDDGNLIELGWKGQ